MSKFESDLNQVGIQKRTRDVARVLFSLYLFLTPYLNKDATSLCGKTFQLLKGVYGIP